MYKHFALSLRIIIRLRNWEDQQLAEEVGVSKTTASRWLNGEQEPKNLQELVNLAKKLGVTTDDLLGLSNEFPAKMNAVMKQLPKDIQEAEFERVMKLLEEYRKT